MTPDDKTLLAITHGMQELTELTENSFRLTKETSLAFQSVMAAYLALSLNLARKGAIDLAELSQTLTEMSVTLSHGRVGKEFLSALSVALSQMQKDLSSDKTN